MGHGLYHSMEYRVDDRPKDTVTYISLNYTGIKFTINTDLRCLGLHGNILLNFNLFSNPEIPGLEQSNPGISGLKNRPGSRDFGIPGLKH